jgi:cation transport ATPase
MHSVNDFDHSIISQKIASVMTYLFSGWLVIGDAMDWLNENASAMGVLIGLATFATNFYFQWKRGRNGASPLDESIDTPK